MNRLPWIAVGAVALALLAFLLWYTPERRAALQLSSPAPGAPASAPVEAARAPATAALRPTGEAPPTAIPGSPAAVIDAGAPDPAGPFPVELGRHTVYLDDPVDHQVMRFTLRLVVANKAAEREARLRREDLVRMTYFLGSHRVALGAIGQEGRDRFAADLLERFRNVVRSGSVDAVELADYEVVKASSLERR